MICRNCLEKFVIRRHFENRNACILFCKTCKEVEFRDERQWLDENLQKNSDIIFPEKMQSQVIESYDVRVFDGFNL